MDEVTLFPDIGCLNPLESKAVHDLDFFFFNLSKLISLNTLKPCGNLLSLKASEAP